MMTNDVIPFPPSSSWPVDHIGHGPVMADEVKISSGESVCLMSEVSDHGQRLKKYFR